MADKLTAAQTRYWAKKLPGASDRSIRIARAKQIYNHNPDAVVPGSGLTPLALNQQVAADTSMQYGQQMQQTVTNRAQVDPVYDAYARSIAQLNAQNDAAQQQAVQDITTRASGLAATDKAQVSNLITQLQMGATSRGTTLDPSIAANAQQANTSNQAAANSDAAAATTTGLASGGFLRGQAALGEGARAQKKLSLDDAIAQLKGTMGQFGVQDRAKIISGAVDQATARGNLAVSQQNANTAAGVAGVNAQLGAQKVAETVRTDKAKEKNTRRQQNVTARGQDLTRQTALDRLTNAGNVNADKKRLSSAQFFAKYGITVDQANKGVKPKTTSGGLTPYQQLQSGQQKAKQKTTANEQYHSAIGLIQQNHKGSKKLNPNDEANLLASSKHAIPYNLGYAAAQTYLYGGVGPKTQADIKKQYGITLPLFKAK